MSLLNIYDDFKVCFILLMFCIVFILLGGMGVVMNEG